MGKSIPYVFLGISVAFFLFLVGLTGYRVETARRANVEAARAKSRELLDKVVAVRGSSGGFESPFFKEKMRDIFNEESRLLVLDVYSDSEGILYLITRNKSYLKEPREVLPEWRGTPVYHSSPGYETLFTLPLPSPYEGVRMDALLVVFGREDLYPVLRDDLYLLLAFLIVCGIFILIFASVQDEGKEAQPPLATEWPPASPSSAPPPSDTTTEPGPAFDGIEAPPSIPPFGASEEEHPVKTVPEDRPTIPKRETPASADAPAAPPTGGLSQHHDFTQRLKSEIERAASSDQDLSVAIASIDNPPSGAELSAAHEDITALLKECFPLHDLIFESGSDSYALILPDVEIDPAVRSLDAFRLRVAQAALGERPFTISAGVSSRGGRLIEGETLHEEAMVSMRKAAREGGNRVIGFRADPAKFREAITGLEGRETPE